MTETAGLSVLPDTSVTDETTLGDAIDTSLSVGQGDLGPSDFFDTPQWRPLATDTESRPSTPENEGTENNESDIPVAPISSDHIALYHNEIRHTLPALAEVSPSPSPIVPRAPPTTPTVPKREIKLVTAGSSAADWFTRGFVGFPIAKKEVKDEKPAFVAEKGDTLSTPENVDHLKTDLDNLISNASEEVEIYPTNAVTGTAKMTCTSPLPRP